jgi:outer membrane protein OmpA-like peptidoglycan-associated protein
MARSLRPLLTLGASALVVAIIAPGCAGAAALRGRIEGLNALVDRAEKNGAMRCAPRELALAKANLRFATVEADQGMYSQALALVDAAEPNARAALANSPVERCAERKFVEVKAKPAPVVPKAGDKDGDGLLDDVDKCPEEPEVYNGFEDADGCPDDPDSDNDGIADSKDQCLLDAEDKDGYLDDDGCPDVDNDLDGVLDGADKCPNKPEDTDGFEDADGCPDPDNDGDTVADLDDWCPNTPGQVGGERPGCPKKSALIVVTAKEIRITQQIQFEYYKAVIKGDVSFKILDEIVSVLRDNAKIAIEVQGHTDNRGNAKYNEKLSQSRADAVRAYLVQHGIEPARLTSKGYGMSLPLVPNTTDGNRAINRRVQFIRTESGSQLTVPAK